MPHKRAGRLARSTRLFSNSTEIETSNLFKLGVEIWCSVFRYLSRHRRLRCRAVCKLFRSIIDNEPSAWGLSLTSPISSKPTFSRASTKNHAKLPSVSLQRILHAYDISLKPMLCLANYLILRDKVESANPRLKYPRTLLDGLLDSYTYQFCMLLLAWIVLLMVRLPGIGNISTVIKPLRPIVDMVEYVLWDQPPELTSVLFHDLLGERYWHNDPTTHHLLCDKTTTTTMTKSSK